MFVFAIMNSIVATLVVTEYIMISHIDSLSYFSEIDNSIVIPISVDMVYDQTIIIRHI